MREGSLMEYVPIDETNWERVNEFIESQWLTTEMVIRGRVVVGILLL